ncbi:RING finger protein 122 isoform X1 [Gasterosteus aculeatus]
MPSVNKTQEKEDYRQTRLLSTFLLAYCFYRSHCLVRATSLLSSICSGGCGLIPSGASMSPFDWCNGCYCGRGPFQPCSALSLPDILETYIFFFVIILLFIALGFCCYAPFSKLHQNDNKWPVYKEVVYNGDPEKMNILGQTCAVCLEDFKVKDEMAVCPCQHGFHKK